MRASIRRAQAILSLLLRFINLSSGVQIIPNLAGDDHSMCTLSLFIPFNSDNASKKNEAFEESNTLSPAQGYGILTEEDYIRDEVSLLSIATLAIDDFNHKNSSFIQDLESHTGSNCNTKFSDIRLIHSDGGGGGGDNNSSSSCNVVVLMGGGEEILYDNQNVTEEEEDTISRRATTTPRRLISSDSVAWGLSIGSGVPNNLILSTATWQDRMDTLMDYLELTFGTTTSALLYDPTYGSHLTHFEAFKNAAEERDSSIRVYDSPSDKTTTASNNKARDSLLKEQIEEDLRTIRSHHIDIIVVAWDDTSIDDSTIGILAEVAMSLDMLDGTYTWIFTGLSPQYIDRFQGGDTLSQMFSYSMIFQVLDPFTPLTTTSGVDGLSRQRDLFLKEMRGSRSSNLLDIVNKIVAKRNEAKGVKINATLFDDNRRPAYGSGFLYDSILAAGICACNGVSDKDEKEEKIDSTFLNVDFPGVTGRYRIQNGVRMPGMLQFGMYVIQQEQETDVDDEDRNHIAMLQNYTMDGKWVTLKESSNAQKDTTDGKWMPQAIQGSINVQTLSRWAFIMGLTLAGIAFIFCLGSSIFLYRNWKNAIVKMSQPMFLQFVCFGSSFFAFSIVFQSFDDNIIVDNRNLLDSMCMLQVWMAYTGQIIIYMSLFSKLWRVKKVGQMRKNTTVLPRHVIWPFLLVLAVSFCVLVSWTIVDPAEFERIEVVLKDDVVSFPLCTYEAGFHFAIQVPLFISMLIVLTMSFKTRKNLPEQVTDSRRIARVLYAHVLISLFGFALIAVGYYAMSNYNFVYMIRVLTNFFYSICTVGLLIYPRFIDIQKEKRGTLERSYTRGQVRVSGLDPTAIQSSRGSLSQSI